MNNVSEFQAKYSEHVEVTTRQNVSELISGETSVCEFNMVVYP